MTIKINKLINDLKLFVDEYVNPCGQCRADGSDESDCAECLKNTTPSERVRSYEIFGSSHTDKTWIDWAFNDRGANLSPSWYDFDPEKISDDEREQIEIAMENYLKG